MRHLDAVPAPTFFASAELRRLFAELAAFHAGGGTRTRQVRGSYGIVERIRRHVGEHLREVAAAFDGVCAYTEQRVVRPALVTHRPEADAQDLAGDVAPDHYWWLLERWDNWYLVEADVARRKGTLFPTRGERARPPDGATGPTDDEGLLLDPREDHPQWWLRARPDGTYAPARHPTEDQPGPSAPGPGRGEVTIELLGLNEPHLVRARALAFDDLGGGAVPDPTGPFRGFRAQRSAQELLRAADGADASAGPSPDRAVELAPQLVPLLLEQPRRASGLDLGPGHVERVLDVADGLGTGEAGLARLRALLSPDATRPGRGVGRGPDRDDGSPRSSPAAGLPPAAVTPADPGTSGTGDVVHRDDYVARVEIRDYRCIDHVVLDLSGAAPGNLPGGAPRDPPGAAHGDLAGAAPPWTGPERRRRPRPTAPDVVVVGAPPDDIAERRVPCAALLGENGCGKSSVLQAVALCLAGSDAEAMLTAAGIRLADLVREHAPRAEVTVTFGRGATTHLSFDHDGGDVVVRTPRENRLLVRGLGASRAAARGPASERARATVDVANLFDPRTPALDVDAWAAMLHDRDDGAFNVAAATLKDVLGLGEDRPLAVVDGELAIDGQPLRLLSDGYRALVSLVCAVMAASDMDVSETDAIHGVVLVDEIGAHLHPRWRMDVTRKLRDAFPQVQLLLTTHEPLCLRGLREREVVRVVRPVPGAPPLLEAVERSPSAYRVDQLLTSEFFGLSTTIDPALQEAWDEHHRLALAVAAAPSPDQELVDRSAAARERALAMERDFSAEHVVLGTTRRAQLAYEVLDRFLEAEPQLSGEERAAARRRAVAAAAELYRPRLPDTAAGAAS